ncbi:MAG: 2-oxoacid:acceptor oxidoreductase family protein [Nitrospinota bacterium]
METKVVEMKNVNEFGFYEIRMESIGGQGANLAGKVLGEAGVLNMGINGLNFSSYGSEKRGAPVKAFVRFAPAGKEIYVNSPVERPQLLAIFHEQLIKTVPVMAGVTPETVIIVNTARTPDEMRDVLKMNSGKIVCIDALKIAMEEGTRVNTALLGTIAKFSGFIDPEAVKASISHNLGKKYAKLVPPNLKTFDRGYNEGVLKEFADDGKYPPVDACGGVACQKIGYLNQPIGGVIPVAGTSIQKDLSPSREGWIPVLNKTNCKDCGECDITCPDMTFEWTDGTNALGKEGRVLVRINYQYCKGCLRCVQMCKFDALHAHKEAEVDEEILKKGFTRV